MTAKKEILKDIIKLKQKKFREESNQFLIEGIHLIEECLKSKFYKKNIVKVFVRNDFNDNNILDRLRNVDIEVLNSMDFKRLSDTENSQGIIGLVFKTDNLPAERGRIICAIDNLNDPGNLGTILRLCWWFGIENILISKNSVDIYNSKVIRASQGAIFNLIIKDKVSLPEELGILHRNNYNVLLTDLKTDNTISSFKINKEKDYVLVFGNEANGISGEIRNVANYDKIKIDSYTKCESLNVATSAAIIFYEFRKSLA